MLQMVRSWVASRRIEAVRRRVEDMHVESIGVCGIELADDECEALRVGILAGLTAASLAARGLCGRHPVAVADGAMSAAADAYGKYLREADNGQG